MLAAERHNANPANLGSSVEISIRDLVALIAEWASLKGEIAFDANQTGWSAASEAE